MPVTIDMTALDKLRTLGAEGLTACDVAVKRTARKSRPVIISAVAGYYKVAEKTISKAIRIPRTAERLVADVKIYGDRLPLMGFTPQPSEPFTGGIRPKNITIDIKYARVALHQRPDHAGQFAFIARMATGHVGIFRRTGVFGRVPKANPLITQTESGFKLNAGKTARLERIAEMYTVGLPNMVISKTVYAHVSEALTSLLHAEAETEYNKTVKAIFKGWAS